MTKPHVVIAINTSWNILNFRAGLIRTLLAQGWRVTALAPEDESVPALLDLGCEVHPIEIDNKGTSPLRDIQLYFAYRRILAKLHPNAFLGYTIKPNIYGGLAAQALGIPVINNVSGLGTVFIEKNLITRIAKWLYQRAFRRSDHVFFQNADDQRLFVEEKLVNDSKTSILPGSGIDLTHFAPAPLATDEMDGKATFLMIARFLKDKGVYEYIDAARAVKRQYPEARFQMLGFLDAENRTAVQASEMQAWVDEGVVEYLGSAKDVRPFIQDATCVVLPSYREGTPRTLLEAAAMQRPLITTDVPGCREVVVHASNGFLCTARDADALAQVMQDFLALDLGARAKMGAQSRHMVEKRFDEKLVIAAYVAALAAAVQHPKGLLKHET